MWAIKHFMVKIQLILAGTGKLVFARLGTEYFLLEHNFNVVRGSEIPKHHANEVVLYLLHSKPTFTLVM